MSGSVKCETIEVSDSDGSTGGGRGTEHVALADGWVRRSTRARKVSVRFSPDRSDAPAPAAGGARGGPAPTAVGAVAPTPPPLAPRQTRSSSDSSSSSCLSETVDPQLLITYVDELKRKIRPGAYSVKMPIGPNEFVLVDGVDYLRNLGYSDFEEEDEEDYSLKIDFNAEEPPFEPQPVEVEDEDTSNDESNNPGLEVNFWDSTKQSAGSSFLSLSRDSEVVSIQSLERLLDAREAADVELLVPEKKRREADVKLHAPKKRRRRAEVKLVVCEEKSRADVEPLVPKKKSRESYKRRDHNETERFRRLELSTHFSKLCSIVLTTDSSKVPKVRVLTEALRLIDSLKRDELVLSNKLSSLVKSNADLKQKHDSLVEMSKSKRT